MPGTAAWAVAVSESTKTISTRILAICEIAFFMVISLLFAAISEGVAARHAAADVDFGHHPAEVLGIVRQPVEIRFIEIENAARGIELGRAARASASVIAGIQDAEARAGHAGAWRSIRPRASECPGSGA